MADSDSGARKRARTISSLTEEQIRHKRNVDRKAQRAFRQRTKDGVCNLELQIAQLQKTADEREARFQQQLSALSGDNEILFQCLSRIADLASTTARHIRRDTTTRTGDDDSGRTSVLLLPISHCQS